MSIENEIAGLTQSTTDLLEAVNTKKATLDTAVSNAQTAVTDATSQVSLAAAEKVGAQTARDTAESFKDQAYTYSQSAASAVAYQDLTAIAQTKAENAVDVFVYDTSKDSDGGAWRHRTQHTSWYNEPLNTATRGGRKEFPAVAVIVAESNKVTIYDGDDPSLPMWMVFNQISGGFLYGSAKSVFVVNGIFCCGTGITLSQCDFISDVYFFRNTNGVKWNTNNVFYRNKVGGPYDTGTIPPIVNSSVNDVAMTVLPDAPIDPATGLPIPTIAVATNGGVSVIKDDGTVVDITGFNVATTVVGFFKDNSLYCQGLWTSYIETFEIPSSDTTTSSRLARYDYGISTPSFLDSGILSTDASVDFYKGSTGGLNVLSQNITPANGMINYITSKYNTGWMNGDIKLATLSDTDDTDLVGSELVTNGTFDTDTSGWTAENSTLSLDSGYLKITSTGGNRPQANQNITTVAGKKYVITATARRGTCVAPVEIEIAGISSALTGSTSNTTDTIVYSTFVATGTTHSIQVKIDDGASTSGETAYFDNVSVRLAEPDRSVNGNGLQVFGTVQKNPVATGADLVAYSGFSASNYLSQPYNSDLDFGTDDFCIMGWVKKGTTSNQQTIFQIDEQGSNVGAGSFEVNITPTLGKILCMTYDGSVQTVTSDLSVDNWSHVVAGVKGGLITLYVNGTLQGTTSASTLVSSTSTVAVFGIRSNYSSAPATTASLALWRISGTYPTTEQIKKIYEDEKVLFQENAKATLHGTSDAVTALAYDDTTELLHVGTSSGRSVFQGLRRVDNTTDAVGTAISASDNFIAEE